MKRNFKQWWSTISTITSHLRTLNTNKTTTYEAGNPGPYLVMAVSDNVLLESVGFFLTKWDLSLPKNDTLVIK